MKTHQTHITHSKISLRGLVQGLALTAALLAGTGRAGFPELPVELLSAGDFVILAKTGISTVPSSDITGDMGVSPIDHTAITAFSLIMDGSGEFSTSAQVTGRIYAADYLDPTPTKMTTAIADMETAFTQASLRTTPDTTEWLSGNIGGQTIYPGLHKWSTDVLIANDVTLDALGDPNAVFIFQISGDLTVASGQRVILAGNAQARTIFWQIAGPVGAVVNTTAHIEGVVLTAKAITLLTGASFNGKLLAQTRVDLDMNTGVDSDLIPPPYLELEIISEHGEATPSVGVHLYDAGSSLTNSVTAVEEAGGTRRNNIGWVMVGNEPVSGLVNEMEMVITNNATLTWLWSTDYYLDASANPAAGGGITGDTNGWYAAGTDVTVTAVANPGYAFLHWTGQVGASPGDPTQNLMMSAARTLVANFALTNLTCGTPVSRGAVMELDLDALFSQSDLTYAADSSNPDVMSESVTAGGFLRLEALAHGHARIGVTATDGDGNTLFQSFAVTVVDDVAVISNVIKPNEAWNPRFEQRMVLENTTGLACPALGLRLIFTDLEEGITVENQTGVTPDDGHPMIEWRTEFAEGETREVSIVYVGTGAFRPDQHPPTVTAQYVLTNTVIAPDQDAGFAIDDIRVLEDGRVVLEFTSVAGRRYEIDYKPLMHDDWVTVPLLIEAGGNRTQWMDHGPPATPPLGLSRFYRVREVTP